MIKTLKREKHHRQMGFTLIELMISGLLGSLLLAMTMEWLLIATQSARIQDGLAEINENASFVMRFLRHEIEMAGATTDLFTVGLAPVAWAYSEDQGGRFDTLTIQRQYAAGEHDCLGDRVPADRAGKTMLSRLYVDNMPGQNAYKELRCELLMASEGSSAFFSIKSRALIGGVDAFQVQYGVMPRQSASVQQQLNSSVITYLLADQVDPLHHKVISIKVALLLHNSNGTPLIHSTAGVQTITVLEYQFDDEQTALNLHDGHLRKQYQSTIVLKNAMSLSEE